MHILCYRGRTLRTTPCRVCANLWYLMLWMPKAHQNNRSYVSSAEPTFGVTTQKLAWWAVTQRTSKYWRVSACASVGACPGQYHCEKRLVVLTTEWFTLVADKLRWLGYEPKSYFTTNNLNICEGVNRTTLQTNDAFDKSWWPLTDGLWLLHLQDHTCYCMLFDGFKLQDHGCRYKIMVVR